MSNDRSRWMAVFFVLLSAIPTQVAAMWLHPNNTWVDWMVLAFLVVLGWAHVDTKVPD